MRPVGCRRFPPRCLLAILAAVVWCAGWNPPAADGQQNWLRFGRSRSQSQPQTSSAQQAALTARTTSESQTPDASNLLSPSKTNFRLRFKVDGDSPARWFGNVSCSSGKLTDLNLLGSVWHTPGLAHCQADSIQLHGLEPTRSAEFDATIETTLAATGESLLTIELSTDAQSEPQRMQIPLAEVVGGTAQRTFSGGRLLISRAPGDKIRVIAGHDGLILAPNQPLPLEMQAALLEVPAGTPLDFQITLRPPRGGKPIWDSGPQRVSVPMEGFASTKTTIPLPANEGVYSVHISAIRPAGLRKSFMPYATAKPLAERTFQVLVFDPARRPKMPSDWRTLVELDPTATRWWDRMPEWVWLRRVPWVPRGPLGSGAADVTSGPAGSMIELPAEAQPAWQAYPIPIANPGQPHIVEIEYPADATQELVVSLFDQDPAGNAAVVGASPAVRVSQWETQENTIRTVRKLFWPKTNSPLLVLSNGDTARPCRFGRIRVLAAAAKKSPQPPEDSRDLMAYVGSPNLPAVFGSSYWGSPEYEDLQTWYELATRLADRLNLAEQNGAVVTVASAGGTLYPSKVLARQTGIDRSLRVDGGVDLPRRDPLEMLLRCFDRRGLKLVPSIRFEAALPSSDVSTSAQQEMLAAVHELRSRYGHHASFAGIAIDLTADTLPIERAAQSKRTGDSPGAEWTDFLRQAAGSDPSRQLFLFTHNLLTSANQSLPRLGSEADWPQMNLIHGVDLAALGDLPNLVAVTPRLESPWNPLEDSAAWLSVSEAARRHPAEVALIAGQSRSVTFDSFRGASPFGENKTDARLTIVPVDDSSRSRLTELAAEGAPAVILEGGETFPLVLNEKLTAMRGQVRQLASTKLPSKTAGRQPLVVRSVELSEDGRGAQSALELSNPSPWTVEAEVTVRTPAVCQLTKLAQGPASEGPSVEQFDVGQHVLKVMLPPDSFEVMRFSTLGVEPLGVRSRVEATARGQLAERLSELKSHNLGVPREFELVANPSFEKLVADGSLSGWQALAADQSGSVSLASGPTSDGTRALRLSSRGGTVGVESKPFAAPKTGQLAMVFRVRAEGADTGSELRIFFRDPDAAAGRSKTYSTVLSGEQLASSSDSWRPYVFAADDLPLGSAQRLQVKFQLAGRGQVDIDNLQFYDLLFPLDFLASQSANQKLELVKTIHAAQTAFDDGRLHDCRRLLDGYWPRFIRAYTPVIQQKQADQITAQDLSTETDQPEQATPSVSERLKEYLPSFMRF